MSLKSRLFILGSVLAGMALACTAPALSVSPTLIPLPLPVISTETVEVILATTPQLPAEPSPTAMATEAASTATPEIVETAPPIVFPMVAFDRDTNCRLGPARNYFTQTSFLQDRLTIAEGRNADASWLWVQSLTPETRCWISVANLKTPESYAYLPVVDLPPLPEAPTQVYVVVKNCEGRNKIVLQWPNVTGETGFHVYRNGIMLSAMKTDAVEFVDYPPDGQAYIYEVESINNFGLSIRVAVTAAGCQN